MSRASPHHAGTKHRMFKTLQPIPTCKAPLRHIDGHPQPLELRTARRGIRRGIRRQRETSCSTAEEHSPASAASCTACRRRVVLSSFAGLLWAQRFDPHPPLPRLLCCISDGASVHPVAANSSYPDKRKTATAQASVGEAAGPRRRLDVARPRCRGGRSCSQVLTQLLSSGKTRHWISELYDASTEP